jgi:hypothetical protein
MGFEAGEKQQDRRVQVATLKTSFDRQAPAA